MTLIISWIGVDQKKEGKSPSSIYIASDSRYSWGRVGKYDYGIKVFGSSIHPEIFGFCGDVLFPSLVLGQLLPQIDSGLLLNDSDDGGTKHTKIYRYISTSLRAYPKVFLSDTFTILHGTRVGKVFKCYKTDYSITEGLTNEEIALPNMSTKVFSGGSGEKEFDDNWRLWENEKHNNHRTSRGVYHCLIKTLKEIKDPSTGGLPQVVGLYRINNARIFGIVENGTKYIYGKESSEDINSKKIEWRNENFECINPETLKLFDKAQRQPF
jgi:hypothetical protein